MFKKVSTRIVEIKAKAESEIPAIMAANDFSDEGYARFRNARIGLNELLIATVIGAEFVPDTKKGGKKLKFVWPVPTTEELAEITRILTNFCKEEGKYYDKLHSNRTGEPSAEDTIESLGVGTIQYNPQYADIAALAKVNKKNVKGALLTDGFIARPIDATGLMTIAGWGSKVRKDQNLQILLIALATTAVVAGGVTGAVIYYNKKHDGLDVTNDYDSIECGDPDSSEAVEVDDADAPVVDFE